MSNKIEQWQLLAQKYTALCAEDDEEYVLKWDELHQLSQSLSLACKHFAELEALVKYFQVQLDSTKAELAELRSNIYTPDHSRAPY